VNDTRTGWFWVRDFFVGHGVLAATLLAVVLHQQAAAVEELLLPEARVEPSWSAGQREAGYAIWTSDCADPFFENIPPPTRQLVIMPKHKLAVPQGPRAKPAPYFANPTARQLASLPRCISSPGEYEPLIFGIWGLRELGTVYLEAKSERFRIKTLHVLFENRAVPPPPGGGGRRLGIPLFLPAEAEAQVRDGRNTVFWLTIYVPPDTKPGVYNERLLLGFQEAHRTIAYTMEKAYVEIPYTVTVLPYKLPRTNCAFGMYYVGDRQPKAYSSPEYERMYFRDMAEHGHTSAFFGSWGGGDDLGFLKTGKVSLTGSVVEQRVKVRMEAGLLHKDIPIMFIGHSYGDYPGRYVEFARELKKAWAERNDWPKPLLYGPDEVGMKAKAPYDKKHGEGAFMKMMETLGAANKEVRTITALKRTQACRDLGQYFGVWVVRALGFAPETPSLAMKMDRELWTYDADHRGTNPVFHRYYAGIYTWAHRMKGNFLWAYSHSPECSWEGNRTHSQLRYVVPSAAGPVATIGWEARREGIEDYRTFHYLEELVAQHVGDQIASEAGEWLGSLRKLVNYRLCVDHTGISLRRMTDYNWDCADLYDPSRRIGPDGKFTKPMIAPGEYRQFRAKAQAYIRKFLRK